MTLPSAPSIGTAVQELLALNHGLVGASTGFMIGNRGDWEALVDQARDVSLDVVELSALSLHELPPLLAFLKTTGDLPFPVVSVHGPAKGIDSAAGLAHTLADLPAVVAGIVMHPEKLGEPEAFTTLGDRLRLENMDTRKDDARTVKQLTRYFDVLPDARFCLDVAHAHLNDATMAVAHELLDAFSDRLAEVHVSSALPTGSHVPLSEEDAELFWPVLERCVGVPWVLEAPLAYNTP